MSRKAGVEDVHDKEVTEANRTFGSSLPVQSVQEIVRCDPGNVPERYLRNIESTATNHIWAHLSSEIPVIDLSLLSNGDKTELQKLDESCREWGFFQIVNHGIAAEVLRDVIAVTAKFFELPLEEKKKNAMPRDDPQGYRQSFVVSEEQKLDWSDTLNLFIYPEKFRKLSPWPTIPPDFCKATEKYSKEVSRVAQKILIGLFLLMGTGKDDLQKVHGEILQSMRVNYYPICCQADLVVGLSPHSDASSITVLLQDDEITALRIRHSGSWVPVKPIPNALVINVGDVIEIVNHGIAAEVLRDVKVVTAKFFELPLEEKKKYAMPPDDLQGYGQAFVVSEEQNLDWSDILALFIYPEKFRKLSYWPTIPPDFCKATEKYSKGVNRVAQEVLIGLFLLMGIEKVDLLKIHGEMLQSMRVNYYPICCKPDLVVGVSPHSDASSITVLLQDDEIAALQIRHSGGWVPVKPIPNALVINVGDVIEVLSNGRYTSVEHRAMTNKSRERISIASFITPQLHVEIGPLNSCHQDEAKYMKTNYGDFMRSYLAKKLEGKSHIQSIKLDK